MENKTGGLAVLGTWRREKTATGDLWISDPRQVLKAAATIQDRHDPMTAKGAEHSSILPV